VSQITDISSRIGPPTVLLHRVPSFESTDPIILIPIVAIEGHGPESYYFRQLLHVAKCLPLADTLTRCDEEIPGYFSAILHGAVYVIGRSVHIPLWEQSLTDTCSKTTHYNCTSNSLAKRSVALKEQTLAKGLGSTAGVVVLAAEQSSAATVSWIQ
jgi:hypothetical protein